jgi:hypothetical protein
MARRSAQQLVVFVLLGAAMNPSKSPVDAQEAERIGLGAA